MKTQLKCPENVMKFSIEAPKTLLKPCRALPSWVKCNRPCPSSPRLRRARPRPPNSCRCPWVWPRPRETPRRAQESPLAVPDRGRRLRFLFIFNRCSIDVQSHFSSLFPHFQKIFERFQAAPRSSKASIKRSSGDSPTLGRNL